MRINALSHICCPHCTHPLDVRKVVREAPDRQIEFGLLQCTGCKVVFPIVASVLIVGSPSDRVAIYAETTEGTIRPGVTLAYLSQLLEEGRYIDALAHVVAPSSSFPDLLFRTERRRARPRPFRDKPLVSPKAQGKIDRRIGGRLAWLAQDRLARMLLTGLRTEVATDVIGLFYGSFSRTEVSNYFTFRFGQPRYLAALGVASVVKRRPGPLLDLACGSGHLTHYLREPDREVIGLDRDFFRLFVAANFIAESGTFVCAAADRPLPFRSGVFGGAFCSDAFHCFVDKAGCLRELSRVTDDQGVIGIARAGNLLKTPNEGYELTPEGYSKLCSLFEHRMLGEDELIDAYLAKRFPPLDRRELAPSLREQKWVSILMAKQSSAFQDFGSYDSWPHAAGRLGVNPIYVVTDGHSPDALRLKFEFPSEHYAFEDADYVRYAPAEVSLKRQLLESLQAGSASERDADVHELLKSFVLVGMPERYMHDPLCLGPSAAS